MLKPEQGTAQSTDPEDYEISYYTTETDAEEKVNPISSGYQAQDGEIIYVRVENPESGCYNVGNIGEIIISVESRPQINPTIITTDAFCSDEEGGNRSEEHTSELQSRGHLVC